MVLTVYSLFWVMQDVGHQPYEPYALRVALLTTHRVCLGLRVGNLMQTQEPLKTPT